MESRSVLRAIETEPANDRDVRGTGNSGSGRTAREPPRLSHQQLAVAQAETLASPLRSHGLAARALFAALDMFHGKPRTLSKFKVLELVARVPYQAWEQACGCRILIRCGQAALYS